MIDCSLQLGNLRAEDNFFDSMSSWRCRKKSVERIMGLWSLYLNVAKFATDDIDDDLRTSLKVFLVSSVRLCRVIMVFWFPLFFFSNWPCQNVKELIEFQKYFPISAKVMPWSLWKWMGSQCIFEGIKIPNSIGYSPGQAHVTNIDPKCSFFYWA